MEKLNIAIDGPAGAGKSTVAKALAETFGIRYLDTGAMYRAMALFAQRRGVDVSDEAAVRAILPEADIVVRFTDAGQRVLLCGEDVTALLRTPSLSMDASSVSKHPAVRDRLAALQRQVGREYDVVMDGREIGTNVLPHAKLKYFITASPEVRAERRYKELAEKGVRTDFETVLSEIVARDKQDTTRAYMPLKQAEDAVCIDTGNLSVQEVVGMMRPAIETELCRLKKEAE